MHVPQHILLSIISLSFSVSAGATHTHTCALGICTSSSSDGHGGVTTTTDGWGSHTSTSSDGHGGVSTETQTGDAKTSTSSNGQGAVTTETDAGGSHSLSSTDGKVGTLTNTQTGDAKTGTVADGKGGVTTETDAGGSHSLSSTDGNGGTLTNTQTGDARTGTVANGKGGVTTETDAGGSHSFSSTDGQGGVTTVTQTGSIVSSSSTEKDNSGSNDPIPPQGGSQSSESNNAATATIIYGQQIITSSTAGPLITNYAPIPSTYGQAPSTYSQAPSAYSQAPYSQAPVQAPGQTSYGVQAPISAPSPQSPTYPVSNPAPNISPNTYQAQAPFSSTVQDTSMLGNNLADTEKYIDKELQAIGWPKLDLSNKQQTLGCLFSLLKQRSRDVGYREDLQQRIRLLDQDSVNSESNLKKLSVKLDAKVNESKETKLQNDTLTSKVKSLSKQLNTATEEVKKVKSTLCQVKSQYEHEIRKLHLEKEKMKDKISKLVSEKGSKAGSTMLLSNPLDFIQNQDQQKNEDMYNIVISNYEDHEKELMAENAGLREVLLDVFHLINQKSGSSQIANATQFHLPLDMMRSDILKTMTIAIDRASTASTKSSASMESISAEIEIMKKKLDEQDAIIMEQQKLLELSVEDTSQSSSAVVNAEFEKLKLERQILEEEKIQLEEDRSKFTDAAIKLGLERVNLQKERLAIEEERSNTVKVPNPPSLASTPAWLKSKVRKGAFIVSNTSSPIASPQQQQQSKLTNEEFGGGDNWFNSESPEDFEAEDQENERSESSDVLIESQTLNTPISVASKSMKSVRIQSSLGQEGFKKAAETVRLQSSLSLKKRQSPFLPRRNQVKPMATSTPL